MTAAQPNVAAAAEVAVRERQVDSVQSVQEQSAYCEPPTVSDKQERDLRVPDERYGTFLPITSGRIAGEGGAHRMFEKATTEPSLTLGRQRSIREAFYLRRLDNDTLLMNYSDSNSRNFVGDHAAAVRREYRGLVIGVGADRDSTRAMVVARPLHKFFTLNQLPEVELQRVCDRAIESITVKLDGQMVYGIVQGGVVQLWTRSGPTELGVRALATCQELPGDYSGFIRKVTEGGATPVFEYVGRQSHQKASLYEPKHADVVLLAIRSNAMGCYWTYDQMTEWAAVFRIQVVQRMGTLELRAEMCGLEDIVEEVEGFHNCEGVVVRFEDGGWLKIKSKWWQKAGYVKYKTERVREQIVKAKDTVKKKKAMLQHHSLRMAVTMLKYRDSVKDIKEWFPSAKRAEMVHNNAGRLRLAVLAFETKKERDRVVRDPSIAHLCPKEAYSARTRTSAKVRVTVHAL